MLAQVMSVFSPRTVRMKVGSRACPRAGWSATVVLVGLLAILWFVAADQRRSSRRVRRRRRALQVRVDRERAGRVAAAARRRSAAAVLGIQGAAVDLPGEAARRIRVARLHRRAGQGPAGRRVAEAAARRRSGRASTAPSATRAPCAMRRNPPPRIVAGHAGASARPAALRGVRPRVLARQPDDGRERARAVPEVGGTGGAWSG